jgi:hypothetical protein
MTQDAGAADRQDDDGADRQGTKVAPLSRRDHDPVLPDRSADDRDIGWGPAGAGDDDNDDRLERERPPHW